MFQFKEADFYLITLFTKTSLALTSDRCWFLLLCSRCGSFIFIVLSIVNVSMFGSHHSILIVEPIEQLSGVIGCR